MFSCLVASERERFLEEGEAGFLGLCKLLCYGSEVYWGEKGGTLLAVVLHGEDEAVLQAEVAQEGGEAVYAAFSVGNGNEGLAVDDAEDTAVEGVCNHEISLGKGTQPLLHGEHIILLSILSQRTEVYCLDRKRKGF